MFSKAVKPEKTSDAALSAAAGERKAPKPASLISSDLTLEGGVVGEGELHVDGVIRGDVRVGRRLVAGDRDMIGVDSAQVHSTRLRLRDDLVRAARNADENGVEVVGVHYRVTEGGGDGVGGLLDHQEVPLEPVAGACGDAAACGRQRAGDTDLLVAILHLNLRKVGRGQQLRQYGLPDD